MNRLHWLWVTPVLLLSGLQSAWALTISNVQHKPKLFNPAKQKSVMIRYRLSDPAKVTLNIYDGANKLVRSIESGKELKQGDHRFRWDGKDQAKRPVPPEAYHYTLVAKTKNGQATEHDLSDLTGGDNLDVSDIKWDAKTKKIRYRLSKPGRVNIRVGLKNNGPLMRSVINWVPRSAGVHAQPWNGMDTSGEINLTKHPLLALGVHAFSLSDNTIIVGPAPNKISLVAGATWEMSQRKIKKIPKKKMYTHSQQPIEARRDFRVSLRLPDGLKKKKGLPLITKTVPVRLQVDEQDRKRLLNQRFEPVFFVDGQFAFENEVGFLPMTWRWDPVGTNKGVHYLTVNIRGYEGNFGMASIKVYVDNKP